MWNSSDRSGYFYILEWLNFYLLKKIINFLIILTMTYRCKTWNLDMEQRHKLIVTQKRMENKVLEDIEYLIRYKTGINNIEGVVSRGKWLWTGQLAGINNWKIDVTCCSGYHCMASRMRRQKSRWLDENDKYMNTLPLIERGRSSSRRQTGLEHRLFLIVGSSK